MIEHLDRIWWEDSWLLGWEKANDALTLYVDVHLHVDHPLFEPFDKKKVFGCYKTARLVVSALNQVSGLPSDRHGLRWNADLDEYHDVGDIDVMHVEAEGGRFTMEVSATHVADSFRLEVTGQSIDLVFEAF